MIELRKLVADLVERLARSQFTPQEIVGNRALPDFVARARDEGYRTGWNDGVNHACEWLRVVLDVTAPFATAPKIETADDETIVVDADEEGRRNG